MHLKLCPQFVLIEGFEGSTRRRAGFSRVEASHYGFRRRRGFLAWELSLYLNIRALALVRFHGERRLGHNPGTQGCDVRSSWSTRDIAKWQGRTTERQLGREIRSEAKRGAMNPLSYSRPRTLSDLVLMSLCLALGLGFRFYIRFRDVAQGFRMRMPAESGFRKSLKAYGRVRSDCTNQDETCGRRREKLL